MRRTTGQSVAAGPDGRPRKCPQPGRQCGRAGMPDASSAGRFRRDGSRLCNARKAAQGAAAARRGPSSPPQGCGSGIQAGRAAPIGRRTLQGLKGRRNRQAGHPPHRHARRRRRAAERAAEPSGWASLSDIPQWQAAAAGPARRAVSRNRGAGAPHRATLLCPSPSRPPLSARKSLPSRLAGRPPSEASLEVNILHHLANCLESRHGGAGPPVPKGRVAGEMHARWGAGLGRGVVAEAPARAAAGRAPACIVREAGGDSPRRGSAGILPGRPGLGQRSRGGGGEGAP